MLIYGIITNRGSIYVFLRLWLSADSDICNVNVSGIVAFHVRNERSWTELNSSNYTGEKNVTVTGRDHELIISTKCKARKYFGATLSIKRKQRAGLELCRFHLKSVNNVGHQEVLSIPQHPEHNKLSDNITHNCVSRGQSGLFEKGLQRFKWKGKIYSTYHKSIHMPVFFESSIRKQFKSFIINYNHIFT